MAPEAWLGKTRSRPLHASKRARCRRALVLARRRALRLAALGLFGRALLPLGLVGRQYLALNQGDGAPGPLDGHGRRRARVIDPERERRLELAIAKQAHAVGVAADHA